MNGNADLWIGVIAGAVVFSWPWVFVFRLKHLTQAELAKISVEYDTINSSFLANAFLSLLLAIPLILLPMAVARQYEAERARAIVSVWPIVLFSCLGFVQGLFAMRKGVYPTSKFFGSRTTYAYDEGDSVRRLGRLQVWSAVAATAIAVLIGLIRWCSVI